MRLLLDTQAIYLWTIDDAALPPRTIAALSDSRNQATISAASFWEIAIKQRERQARLASRRVPGPAGLGVQEASRSLRRTRSPPGRLPAHHADPFDRILVAQATAEAMTLVGSDPIFGRYGIDVLWG